MLDKPCNRDSYIFLSFSVKNEKPINDVAVTVNGVINRLSGVREVYYNGNTVFHYTCAVPSGTDKLDITFGQGKYELSDVYAGRSSIKNSSYGDKVDLKQIKHGNTYGGAYSLPSGKTLVSTIPYDKNFRIYSDGKLLETERVNTAFLGVKLPKGAHKIRMVYHSPGRNAGLLITIIAGLILIVDTLRKHSRRRNA